LREILISDKGEGFAMRALLVIDMLNDFVKGSGALPAPNAEALVPEINGVIGEFRGRKEPIIFACDSHEEDDEEFKLWPSHSVEGTWGAEIVEGLDVRHGDTVVKKTRYSAFFRTNLEQVLEELGVDTVCLAGLLTDICVLHTAADAAMRDLKIVVLKECTMALDNNRHEWALKHIEEVLNGKID